MREPVPTLIRPMLATAGQLPGADQDAGYGYEMKWDGLRAVVYVDDGHVRILTRSDRDVTAAYPELAGLGALLRLGAVLDGEIVAVDPATRRVSFGALQQRMGILDPVRAGRLAEHTPVTFLAFDLLHLDGRSTLRLPYERRRELLQSLRLTGGHGDTPPYFAGGGSDVLAAAAEHGLEGVVAKRLDSSYQPGRRSPSWIKVKLLTTQEVVIGGWKPGQGRRGDTLGSLLLGIPGPQGLDYVGNVGTGFSDLVLDDLRARLAALRRESSPFLGGVPAPLARSARWVEPELVGEVAFAEWTRDGRLRHPTWRGLRPDKSPGEVVRES